MEKKQPKEEPNEAAGEPLRDEELDNVSGGHASGIDWQVSGPNGFPPRRRRPPLFGPGSGMIGEITGS